MTAMDVGIKPQEIKVIYFQPLNLDHIQVLLDGGFEVEVQFGALPLMHKFAFKLWMYEQEGDPLYTVDADTYWFKHPKDLSTFKGGVGARINPGTATSRWDVFEMMDLPRISILCTGFVRFTDGWQHVLRPEIKSYMAKLMIGEIPLPTWRGAYRALDLLAFTLAVAERVPMEELWLIPPSIYGLERYDGTWIKESCFIMDRRRLK